MIQVTKPFLPPLEEYLEHVQAIWDRKWLTNMGPVSQNLESALMDYLGINNFILVSNGTSALQVAFKALELKGEVITTPFSYIATTSSLLWENLDPVYADIKSDDFNIDPDKIEALITPKTSAILATHVFGCPCDIDALESIAKKHGLVLIFDAAHAFGVEVDGKSILSRGDASTLSFHATKLFHTIEGGGIISDSEDLTHRFHKMRNFGHAGFEDFEFVGINAKCSEFHAAMGLANLKYIEAIIQKRKEVYEKYLAKLSGNERIAFQKIDFESVQYNYSYFPVLIESNELLITLIEAMNEAEIYPRRYFYPSLNKIWFNENKQDCEISEDVSQRILCLPMSYYITDSEIDKITSIILKTLKG